MSDYQRPLRLAMVGGGKDAFIGAVHRHAAALDGRYELVAGALSSTPERSKASAAALGLPPERSYSTWEELLAGEKGREDGAEVISIVTPNHMHFPVALAAVQAGFHVICDKPLVHTLAQAQELQAAAEQAQSVFAVTYNYSGYPLVRQAREMVRGGQLGEIRKVIAEYHQGWLAAGSEGKQADWRTDPARSGPAGALGDIGTHAEQLISFVTGLEMEAVAADLTHFVAGRALDDDANMLLRFEGGAKGMLSVSQIEIGRENDLRLSVFGTKGSLSWRQEDPNVLIYDQLDAPRQLLTRGGPGLGAAATAATRLPAGHPEAFIEAFANIYSDVADDIWARQRGENIETLYPTLQDGVQGVAFVEKVLESAGMDGRWAKF
ncbi:gfo/Idh/MocA family oxidoreductase [Deinococcus psychrotolerans]|uniref:Gfo/Idh/MocA family oxidoreductase n=1 Tax=Deinococcus psychrotolerans TaxID=2489213 RepID=A0A3G8YE86_9DEIO|nr:Gfo/Idh/MocA family oxidoreductase [Deinococcus psychrotolerans]AZI43253.1 gfo/Idh/MocA family oxidoreductase [Deinococcus psychrotolerans]